MRALRRVPTLILGYHRVYDTPRDPYGLCVSPEHLSVHLDLLQQHADVIPLSNVRLRPRGARPRVALTFDDGYRDNLTHAYPLLQAAGAPATFFITAGMIDASEEFWWDRLERLLLAEGTPSVQLDIEVGGDRLWLDARDPAGAARAHRVLHRHLLWLSPEAIAPVLDDLASRLGVDPGPRPERLPLTSAELASLAAGDGVEIGAHSLSHPRLADLPVERQRAEVSGSKEVLEAQLGQAVPSFAYPFGGPDAVSDATVRCVEAGGFLMACTTLEGRVGRRAHPRRLPRCTVRDWDASEFVAQLRGWLER